MNIRAFLGHRKHETACNSSSRPAAVSSQHERPYKKHPCRQKDQLPETEPNDGGQAHQSRRVAYLSPDSQPPAGTPVSTRRAMNPPARRSRRNRIHKPQQMPPASHDPSGPVFSSLCHQNRQTAHQHSLQTLSSSWMANPAAPTMGTHKQGTSHSRMVEPVGIEPTTLCLQSRCSPS